MLFYEDVWGPAFLRSLPCKEPLIKNPLRLIPSEDVLPWRHVSNERFECGSMIR